MYPPLSRRLQSLAALAPAVACLFSASALAQAFNPTPTTRKFPFVGGDVGTHDRLEKVPGRVFNDLQGNSVDAIKYLNVNGFNAVRVGAYYGTPLTTPAGWPDNTNVDHRELNFGLDNGGIDRQVLTASRAKAVGMKVILTIDFGQDKSVSGNWHEFIRMPG